MLRWSRRARADLKAIHDYIAKDSPHNAKAVAREFPKRADQIPATPRIGRMVPELNDPDIREIAVYSWRLIYQLRTTQIFVLTLIHKRRALAPEQLRGYS
jgi:plasmid stabilization system protein ParE